MKNAQPEFGEWKTWFAWRPVLVDVLCPFGRRTRSRYAWLKTVAYRTVKLDGREYYQFVLQDDLSDYLTLEYGEYGRPRQTKSSDSLY
jgi:hypothetical protein